MPLVIFGLLFLVFNPNNMYANQEDCWIGTREGQNRARFAEQMKNPPTSDDFRFLRNYKRWVDTSRSNAPLCAAGEEITPGIGAIHNIYSALPAEQAIPVACIQAALKR